MTDPRNTQTESSSPAEGEEPLGDDHIEAEIVEMPDVEPTAEMLGMTLPDDPDEAQRLLLRELSEARQETGEILVNLQRVAAEFDNFRKRVERDQVENVGRASQRVIESLLPVLDSLDAAMATEATTEAETKMLNGIASTKDLLLEALAREGFEPIEVFLAEIRVFDPPIQCIVVVGQCDVPQNSVVQFSAIHFLLRIDNPEREGEFSLGVQVPNQPTFALTQRQRKLSHFIGCSSPPSKNPPVVRPVRAARIGERPQRQQHLNEQPSNKAIQTRFAERR